MIRGRFLKWGRPFFVQWGEFYGVRGRVLGSKEESSWSSSIKGEMMEHGSRAVAETSDVSGQKFWQIKMCLHIHAIKSLHRHMSAEAGDL